jgi:hypothetical protein
VSTENAFKFSALLIALSCAVNIAIAQQTGPSRPPDPAVQPVVAAPSFKVPENLEFRIARIISEGVRLHAELFSLKSLAGKRLPTVIVTTPSAKADGFVRHARRNRPRFA